MGKMMRLALAILAALAGLLAVPAVASADLTLTPVGGQNFNSPIFVTSPPGDTHRVFVVERGGTIRVVKDGETLAQPFLTVPNVITGGERGLLSMAFDPNYASNRKFYVFYVLSKRCDQDGGCPIRIDEFKRSPDSKNRAKADSQRRVLEIPHPGATNHYGGQLKFGFDGHLYISIGDGAENSNTAQDTGSLLGKLLRINPHKSSDAPYTVPEDNPFVGEPGKNEIYAYGLRNPWRFSFDYQNGDLVLTDVGAGTWEEVNYVPAGDALGAHFGWDDCEGDFAQGTLMTACPHDADPDYIDPTFSYLNGPSTCAIMGGYVSRDLATASDLLGEYLYADLCVGQIRSVDPTDGIPDADTGLDHPGLVSFGQDAQCRLYAISQNGPVARIDPTTPTAGGCND